MNYKIVGDDDCPIVAVYLRKGEEIKLERGAMVYTSNVNIEGKLNSNKKGIGSVLGAIGRSLTSGESMFITRAVGMADDAEIGIAPAIPGKIKSLKVDSNHKYRLNTGAFLACDDTVQYVMKSQGISKAFFGGTGGFFVMETEGDGEILINAFGDLIELEVKRDRPLIIDNEHVVAWDSSLDYDIEIASGAFGFTTGEGLVNHFKGEGKVIIQSRNLHSLADALGTYITRASN